MQVLVLGINGQLGYALSKDDTDLPLSLTGAGTSKADLTKPDTVAAVLDQVRPAVVINAAAYTAVDKAESEPDVAHAVNGEGVGALGRLTAERGLPVIHVSTDYVFDGTATRPYREDDPTGPIGVYGASKLAGEIALRAANPAHIIVRTAWLFSAHGHNFVRTMQRLGTTRDEVRVVADQRGTPTSAADLASALLTIAHRTHQAATADRAPLYGTYHFANAGEATWHGFAEAIFADQLRRSGARPRCTAITTAEYPTPARRPANSRLDCAKIEQVFGIKRRPWEAALQDVLDELSN
jgi:dTDP-4-dehydrorhamnose reductase